MRWMETQARSPENKPNHSLIPAHIRTRGAVTVVVGFNDRARKGAPERMGQGPGSLLIKTVFRKQKNRCFIAKAAASGRATAAMHGP